MVRAGFVSEGPGDLCAPYSVFLLPEEFNGTYAPLAITASGVNVRREPTLASPVIEQLDYDIVAQGTEGSQPAQPGEFDGVYEWYQIKTPRGQLGWVLSKYAGDAGSRRFCFTIEDGQWKLSAWAVGD